SCWQHARGSNRALKRSPGKDHAESHDGLWANTVVVRQPESQEHKGRGPVRDATVINNWTKAWQDLTRDDKPRQNRCDQRGDTQADVRGRNIGEKRHQVVVRGTQR